jgi:PA14 domain
VPTPGGSASVNPTSPVAPLAGITSRATQAGDTVTYAQGNSSYLSLSALPDTGFAPGSGTGPGWTATYYSGSTTTGTPLGSQVVTSLDVTSTPAIVTNAGVSTWSVTYTATLTPAASGVAEFELSAGNNATLSIGGQQVVSYGPGTGSTFTGLAGLTAGVAVPFELDATGLAASNSGGPFGPPTVVDLTWAPQENLLWRCHSAGHHHQHRTPDRGRGRPAVSHRPGRGRRAALPAQGVPEDHPGRWAEPAAHLPHHPPGHELLPDLD